MPRGARRPRGRALLRGEAALALPRQQRPRAARRHQAASSLDRPTSQRIEFLSSGPLAGRVEPRAPLRDWGHCAIGDGSSFIGAFSRTFGGTRRQSMPFDAGLRQGALSRTRLLAEQRRRHAKKDEFERRQGHGSGGFLVRKPRVEARRLRLGRRRVRIGRLGRRLLRLRRARERVRRFTPRARRRQTRQEPTALLCPLGFGQFHLAGRRLADPRRAARDAARASPARRRQAKAASARCGGGRAAAL
mmetsp:Transcript_3847/g.14086  ORF Transcript_3847/g.14086 Transcript_3847/m.14086 type:complete len:247 (-) Transcript_3847:70-810(-)